MFARTGWIRVLSLTVMLPSLALAAAGDEPAAEKAGTAPGGANGAVQFRVGSTFGGDAASFFWNRTTRRLGLGTSAPGDQLEITGNLRLPVSTQSTGVLKVGATPFLHSFGLKNTFLGLDAGNFSMTGHGNTGVGVNALLANADGTCNTALGGETLVANRNGNNNTASGHFSLTRNTDGNDNTANGVLALFSNTIGSRNTANGDNALVGNVSGSDNTASGTFALGANVRGYENTAAGVYALGSNVDGAGNTASGFHALFFNSGNDNAALGWYALAHNDTGYFNTALGASALGANTTGTYNTAIGAQADVSSSSLTNATAIGSRAVVDASNKVRLGNNDVTVIEGKVAYSWMSDLHQKENFRSVDGEEVLTKIRALNLRSWNYIGDNPQQYRHYGPVAQEFFAAFGHDEVGTSGTPTTINSGDEAGILMLAVQALEKRTAEVEGLKAQVAELRAVVAALAAQRR